MENQIPGSLERRAFLFEINQQTAYMKQFNIFYYTIIGVMTAVFVLSLIL